MPATAFILLHWRRQQKIFLQNLSILRKGHDAKAIHDLRVSVKKLRSYLKLLNLLLKAEFEKDFEKTEQLFAVLGKHRDIEIGLLLLQAFEKADKMTYTAFRFQLKTALQRTDIWVKDALSKYDEKELMELTSGLQQKLKGTDNSHLLEKAKAIIDKETKSLKRDAKYFLNQPHEMRKALKNVFYWIDSCPKDFVMDRDRLKKFKKSLDWLGDWQDLEMLHEKVKHFRKDFVPDARDEYEMLKKLERSIKEKMEEKLRKAEENFKELIVS